MLRTESLHFLSLLTQLQSFYFAGPQSQNVLFKHSPVNSYRVQEDRFFTLCPSLTLSSMAT